MDNVKIGSFIAECRKEKQITQQNLADMLNITNKAVSKWENGYGLPDITLLTDLASILGVSVDEILNGEKKEDSVSKVTDINMVTTTDKIISNNSDVLIKYFVHKSIDKFNMMAIVSIILSIVGVIIQYIIWTETKDLTGWLFGCWFCICSAGIFYYFNRLMKNQIREYNASADTKMDAIEISKPYLTNLCIIWGFMALTIIVYFI